MRAPCLSALLLLVGCAEFGPSIVPASPVMHQLTVYLDVKDPHELRGDPTESFRDALFESGMRYVAPAERDRADVWVKVGPGAGAGSDNRSVAVTVQTSDVVLVPATSLRCGTGIRMAAENYQRWADCIAAKLVNLLAERLPVRALAEQRHPASPAPAPLPSVPQSKTILGGN
jgi:hypothetical protein